VSWEELAGWWLGEVSDPAYDEVVTPLLLEVLPRGGGGVVADLGSGDGRLMPVIAEATGGRVVGVELVEDLARESAQPVVLSRLPMLPLETGSLDGACVVLVLEHVEDHEAFFNETARAVKPGGFLVVVANHPFWTAPGSTPISDTDGEILWRPGRYFERGATVEPAGSGEVTFFHRSMSELTNAAAAAGWHLLRLVEKASHHVDMDSGVPRLAAFAWRRCDVL
jgi:SAM-dependent methyltransferase